MRVRRWAIGGLSAAGAVLLAGAAAWACVSGPAVNLSTVNAKPGDTVNVSGTGFKATDAGTIRWNALDGPVVGQFAAPTGGTLVNVPIVVPADAKAGNYVLIITQNSADGKLSQMPVRALLTVSGTNGANPVLGAQIATEQSGRAAGLQTTDNSVSGATLALVGLGVAGVGMFVAGMAALFAGRRSPAPAAAKVRS